MTPQTPPLTPLARRIAERKEANQPEKWVPAWRRNLTARDESGRVKLS